MNTNRSKMAEETPMTSTPIKRKYLSIFKQLARLPSRLFGRHSGDSFDLLNMDVPKNPFLVSAPRSPCRHSPRLLSNGYYNLGEDSLCLDDLGNMSLSPTQFNVSYKENVVRIFRKRRRSHAHRTLDMQSTESQEDRPSSLEDDICDYEPLALEKTYNSLSECDGNAANTSVRPANFPESIWLRKPIGRVSSEYSLHTNNEDTGPCNTGSSAVSPQLAATLPNTRESELCAEKSVQRFSSALFQHRGHGKASATLHPITRFSAMAEVEDYADETPEHYSTGGYIHVNNGAVTFSHDIRNWKRKKRNPVILEEEVSVEVGAVGHKINSHLVILFLCLLIFFFARVFTDEIIMPLVFSFLLISLAYFVFSQSS
ncbi:transmembrane protein 71 isoform X2 [Mixophyes fleayi]|uniref:transmembrane protein 71 isoform X2 n=1 Tax=Mixophyes fleayi TaxID=3061075 RepID=UPI003F4E144A